MHGLLDDSPGGGEQPSAASTPSCAQAAGGSQRGLLALAGLVAALLALMLSAVLGHLLWPSSGDFTAGASPSGVHVVALATGSPADVSVITAKVDPGLVDVVTNLSYQNAASAGTGIVLTANGEVLTNNHVIEGATSISVTDIGNGKTYSATVVGYDPSGDVALLQLHGASGLQTPSIGNSVSAAVGQSILGIGNAHAAGGTPSAAEGSITALHQSISVADPLAHSAEHLSGMIKTSANIQLGDSGGPLVNGAGQVIGVDTASGYFGSHAETVSRAYAIPIDTARAVAAEIEAGHGSTIVHVGATAFVGIYDHPTDSASSGVNGLEVDGALPGTPAAKAGLVRGDVLTSFNGHAVASRAELSSLLLVLHPGARAQITWINARGTSQSSTITLASGPPS